MTAFAAAHPFSVDPAYADDVRFVWRSLQALCAFFGIDPYDAAGRRRKDASLFLRKMLFYSLKPFTTGTMLAKVTGFNRSTIEDDYADVASWRSRDDTINELMDELADSMESWKSVIGKSETALDIMTRLHAENVVHKKAVKEAPPPPKVATPSLAKQNLDHMLVMALVRHRPLTQALGPIVYGIERPQGAMCWAHVEDSIGGQVIRIGWAGSRDTIEDAKHLIQEAMRIAGKRVQLPEVLQHPTLKMKYQALVRVGEVVVKPGTLKGAAVSTVR